MDASPLHNRLKGILITAACLLLAIYLGYMIGDEQYGTLMIGTAAVGLCAFWFFSGRFFWVLTFGSFFLGGTFPILQGQFTPFQLLMAMGLVKFLVEDFILRRVRLKMPSRFDLLMIIGFMSIIFIHGLNDRFGMRYLGSTIWGGRHYLNVFVGLVAFFVIQSIPMKPGLWSKFPYVVLATTGFDVLIAIITTIAPNSIYFIYPFYSAVSTSGLQEVIGGPDNDVTGRIGAIGNFGVILIILIFSKVSVRRLFHPANVFRLIGLGIGSLAVLLSGYRSAVITSLLAGVTVGVRDLRAAAFGLLPLAAVLLFILSVVNSEVVALPKQVQRALVFVPGHWDSEMAQDARASNDFRYNVWSLWWNQYFPEQPLLGRGFGFKSQWVQKSIYHSEATDYRQMVETGNIHNGLFATLDSVGIIGTLFFLAWNVVIVARAFKISLQGEGPEYRTLRFLAIYLASSSMFYWIGATTVGSALPGEFALVGLFLRLRTELNPPATIPKRQSARPPSFPFSRRELIRA